MQGPVQGHAQCERTILLSGCQWWHRVLSCIPRCMPRLLQTDTETHALLLPKSPPSSAPIPATSDAMTTKHKPCRLHFGSKLVI